MWKNKFAALFIFFFSGDRHFHVPKILRTIQRDRN